jgi:threonyl-tRNA synthetase
MQAKLRDAQEQQIPVMLVVGDRDQEARAVSPRLRTGASTQGEPLDDFVKELRTRIDERQLWPRPETSSDDSSGDGAKPSRQREASASAS